MKQRSIWVTRASLKKSLAIASIAQCAVIITMLLFVIALGGF